MVLEAVRGIPRVGAAKQTIQQRFEQFHADNPDVYDSLVRLARRYHRELGTWPGIGMLWEVCRWELAFETRTVSIWRMNNNFRSRYARLMIERGDVPEDAFETRELRAA